MLPAPDLTECIAFPECLTTLPPYGYTAVYKRPDGSFIRARTAESDGLVEIEPITRSSVQQIGHTYRRVWLVRIEDTDAWGYAVEGEVQTFMADFTLVQKWPLTGLALYEYLSP